MRSSLRKTLVDIYAREDAAYVRARRWRYEASFAHAPTDFFGNAVVTFTLAFIFLDDADPVKLLLWLAAINLLSAARLVVGFLAPQAPEAMQPLLRTVFTVSLVLHGLAWSVSFFLLAPEQSITHRAAVLVWLAGTASWVVAAYTLVLEGVLGFLALQILPVAGYLLMSADRFWQLVAIAALTFFPAMAMIAIRNNALLIQGQITRIEKEELVEALAREKESAESLNETLQADIGRRRQIESDLREAKNRAEDLAQKLEKLSALDGLTAIANRRRFDQMIEREWNRAARQKQPLALILCDIDYFKQYNDRYGHQAGDACLRQLAALLDASLRRAGDLAARYGGEEFAVLLPGTGLSNAQALADNLRASLHRLGIPHDASRAAPVLTASFGVAAMIPDRDSDPARLVRAADEALYQAKHRGRNRVAVADGLAPAPDPDSTRLH